MQKLEGEYTEAVQKLHAEMTERLNREKTHTDVAVFQLRDKLESTPVDPQAAEELQRELAQARWKQLEMEVVVAHVAENQAKLTVQSVAADITAAQSALNNLGANQQMALVQV